MRKALMDFHCHLREGPPRSCHPGSRLRFESRFWLRGGLGFWSRLRLASRLGLDHAGRELIAAEEAQLLDGFRLPGSTRRFPCLRPDPPPPERGAREVVPHEDGSRTVPSGGTRSGLGRREFRNDFAAVAVAHRRRPVEDGGSLLRRQAVPRRRLPS